MNCPNCGALEHARVRTCLTCGAVYASEDLLELRQLEFLLKETEQWPNTASKRKSYGERLEALKARILPTQSEQSTATSKAAVAEAAPTPVTPPAESKAEAVPFDQWLLSERNIKIALYTGGLLLVLAGLIFVGVNWGRIPGPAKFAITLLITGLMYLGGYLLYQRPMLKLGGVTLLGIASGFVPLNFVVLQIYVFSAHGLSANMMWFIGSLPTLLLYFLTAYWTRADLFGYLSIGAILSAVTAGLVLLHVPLFIFIITYTLLALIFLLAAHAIRQTQLAESARTPLIVVTQFGMPMLFLTALVAWITYSGCDSCSVGSPWLGLGSMFIGVLFYVATDLMFGWILARWAAAFAFALAFALVLIELDFSTKATAITLMILSILYLLVANGLQARTKSRAAGWPLYAAGYGLAAFVTALTLSVYAVGSGKLDDVAQVLTADVVLLIISAWAHGDYKWIYGATWLFIAPVAIYSSIYLHDLFGMGLALGVLMLNYTAIGYVLGRRRRSLSGPFLTAAAFLSILVVALTWENPVMASVALSIIATCYLLIALWLGWSWLLYPALASVQILVISILRSLSGSSASPERVLTISYAVLGIALILGGAALRRLDQRKWAGPLYVVGALNVTGTFISGLFLTGLLPIALSVIFGLLTLWLAWEERKSVVNSKNPPLLTYLGIGLLFTGHFYVFALMADRVQHTWPVYTAAVCALLIVISWPLRGGSLDALYGTPSRRAGSWLLLIPTIASVMSGDSLIAAITFGIAGIIFAADAYVRRILNLAYLSIGTFIIVVWTLLQHFEVTEPQAYVLPLGLGLVAVGWNEKRLGRPTASSYRWSTILGLLILMGTAFVQSLDSVGYAVLLLVESLLAMGWGIRTRSRGYVQLAALSMVANALVQFGPGFMELSRWIQLAVIGLILLGGGMAGLFRREQLLATRNKLVKEWRSWEV